MISEFLTWWGQQLSSLRPAQGITGRRDAIVAALRVAGGGAGGDGDGGLDVAIMRRGRAGELGSFPLSDSGMAALAGAVGRRRWPVELRLPPGLLLEQSVALPLAAERDPARVLGYEMDRLTPFAPAELYWGWAIERRDRARGQVHVRLSLVPRSQIDPVLDRLRQAGLPAVAVQGAGGRRIRLGDSGQQGWQQTWQRRGGMALAAAAVVLAIATVVVPFAGQSLRARAVEQRIAALRPAVDQVDALRRRMSTASAGLDVLATQRAKVGDALAVLAALTDVLPDDTVLTDVSLSRRVIAISGQSTEAARLISRLAADPAIRNPTFAAPVTRNDTTHSEGFSIRAEAAP